MFGAEQRVEEKYTLSQAILRWAYLHSISALYCLFCTEDTMNDTSNHNVGFQGSWCFLFLCHIQAITKILLHPENSALVITAAMDGIIKVNSLDFMEEIYRWEH